MSYTRLIRLPEGSSLSLVLCDAINATTNACALEARTDWAPRDGLTVSLRPGPHAVDRSYSQLYLASATCNVSIEYGGGQQLLIAATVVHGCEHAALVAVASGAWQRLHDVHVAPSSLTLVPRGEGLRTSALFSTVPAAAAGAYPLPSRVATLPHLALLLRNSAEVGISSDAKLSVSTIRAKLQSAWMEEQARYAKYGNEHAEVKMAVQAGVMWNTIYNPLEGVIAPVIRGNPWGWDTQPTSGDWTYVLYDWDTNFAAYMLGLDSRSLGYSVLIQIIKAKSAKGFVPNGMAPERKSTHSQPPVGSRVLLELYRRYQDAWLVELLFDDLLDWSNWFHHHRRLQPLNITALGGDDMQAARYESGLDNSPMYDGEFFVGVPPTNYGLMQLYDVGMASIVAMSDESLAELAGILNRSRDQAMLRARAAAERSKIRTHLWDDASGCFVNKFPNGSFYRRVTPTSFYPLLAGAASEKQAEAMTGGWLMNASRFCLSAHGDFVGNTDSCYWGLPSVSADDPAFPALGYWRGFVWGPMALLTYWGLTHPSYASLASVTQARKALVKQMSALLLSQWRSHGHICENFSPWRNAYTRPSARGCTFTIGVD